MIARSPLVWPYPCVRPSLSLGSVPLFDRVLSFDSVLLFDRLSFGVGVLSDVFLFLACRSQI